jgi:hypothetical protein
MLQLPCVQQLQFSPFFNSNATGEEREGREKGKMGVRKKNCFEFLLSGL